MNKVEGFCMRKKNGKEERKGDGEGEVPYICICIHISSYMAYMVFIYENTKIID
jgi:hypothetical protein